MNHRKKKVPSKGNSCVFPEHLANITRDNTSIFDNKLVLVEGHT